MIYCEFRKPSRSTTDRWGWGKQKAAYQAKWRKAQKRQKTTRTRTYKNIFARIFKKETRHTSEQQQIATFERHTEQSSQRWPRSSCFLVKNHSVFFPSLDVTALQQSKQFSFHAGTYNFQKTCLNFSTFFFLVPLDSCCCFCCFFKPKFYLGFWLHLNVHFFRTWECVFLKSVLLFNLPANPAKPRCPWNTMPSGRQAKQENLLFNFFAVVLLSS